MSSAKFTICFMMFAIISKIARNESLPNIVFIMFDDLSMSELSYNGGMINTTVLDSYASSGIRLNFHYSEQVCSPSRAAFMTGRYSWKSGLNSLAGVRKNVHFDPSAVLFPQLLKQAGYNVDIAGKWHIGYKYESILPFNRGFQTGLYGHTGTGYYGNDMNSLFSKIDEDFPLTQKPLKRRRKCVFGTRLPTFDLFAIVDNGNGTYSEETSNVNHSSYVDDLYAEHTRSFIANQTANTSFFTILNLYTPHSDTTLPPNNLPATFGNMSMGETYSNLCEVPPINTTNKTVLCKQLIYAEQLIEGIIDELKNQSLYDETIVIIASDNGGASIVSSGTEYADTMPLRGRKSSSFEGGTRTSVIMLGGWITNNVIGNSTNSTGCDYNNLMHISDWYHLFMKISNISASNASPLNYTLDVDHSGLEIWEDIRCECGSNNIPNLNQCAGSTEENPFTQRTEMIQLQTCSTKQHPTKTDFLTARSNATEFFSTYIRKTITNETSGSSTEYKLVMGGSTDLIASCPIDNETKFNHLSSYSERTGAMHIYPDWIYYNQYYLPFKEKHPTLYKSSCLDSIVAEDATALNDSDRTEFQYSNSLLYQIADDTIEACDISATHSSVVSALEEALQNASAGYLVSDWNAEKSIGAFYSQLMSYECDDYITTLVAWEGMNETLCNTSTTTGEVIDCNEVWRLFIRKGEICCQNNSGYSHCDGYYEEGCGGFSATTTTAELEFMIPVNNFHDYDEGGDIHKTWYATLSFISAKRTIFAMGALVFCASLLLILCLKREQKQLVYDSVIDECDIITESQDECDVALYEL